MTCLRPPVSLADAQAIIVACTGPDWRGAFLLGLGVVVAVAFAAGVVWLAWRGV